MFVCLFVCLDSWHINLCKSFNAKSIFIQTNCLVSYTGHSLGVGVLPLCREVLGVLYSPSRLGNKKMWCHGYGTSGEEFLKLYTCLQIMVITYCGNSAERKNQEELCKPERLICINTEFIFYRMVLC